jgi:hypothetical protein
MTNSIGVRSINQETQVTWHHIQSTFLDMFCSNTAPRGDHNNVPDKTSPNIHSEVDLISTFMDIMRNIPCPEVTAVNSEHIPICRTSFTHTQTFFFKIKRTYIATHTLATTEYNHLETDVHSNE